MSGVAAESSRCCNQRGSVPCRLQACPRRLYAARKAALVHGAQRGGYMVYLLGQLAVGAVIGVAWSFFVELVWG